ncbi:hypothetical protein RI367_008828 [Sorochytrium milnesiophthora]
MPTFAEHAPRASQPQDSLSHTQKQQLFSYRQLHQNQQLVQYQLYMQVQYEREANSSKTIHRPLFPSALKDTTIRTTLSDLSHIANYLGCKTNELGTLNELWAAIDSHFTATSSDKSDADGQSIAGVDNSATALPEAPSQTNRDWPFGPTVDTIAAAKLWGSFRDNPQSDEGKRD